MQENEKVGKELQIYLLCEGRAQSSLNKLPESGAICRHAAPDCTMPDMNLDVAKLKKIKMIRCEIVPHRGAPDDGLRFLLKGRLPAYLRRQEIINADALDVICEDDWSGKALFRFYHRCRAGCDSLGDPVQHGCCLIHVAAHHPDWTFAEFAAAGTPVVLAMRLFSAQDSNKISIIHYSDQSVSVEDASAARTEAYRTVLEFLAARAQQITGSLSGSAMSRFHQYSAERPEWWLQAFFKSCKDSI